MRSFNIFILVAVVCAGVIVAAVLEEGTAVIVLAGILLCLLVWMYISVIKPVNVATRGMELLGGQEYNNRLSKVGEYNADRIVDLFNRLITKLSEERLKVREQNHFLDLLIEVSPIGVAVMDFEGRICLVNKEFLRITGMGKEEITGRHPVELQGEIMEYASGLRPGETRTVRMGDLNIYRFSRLSFMERGFRKPFLLIERLTEEVRKAEKTAYAKIIRTISHEVNNSLGGINSFLEVLSEDSDLSEDYREVAESCKERAESLAGFIKSYADIVKLPAPVRKPTDINIMLNNMRPFLQNMMTDGIELDFDLSSAPLVARADEAQLEQVIVNVVKNARESITGSRLDGEGKITVRTLSTGEIRIDDNGGGIKDEISDKLFTPFFTTRRDGQGIGLTLASEVLGSHGWSFSLRTLPDGITRFAIKFA